MSKKETVGVVYILTNPSFPKYVKIGYADNVEARLKTLNSSECIPFAFRLYAYYEVNHRLDDIKVHDMIDGLNPSLRSIDTINGKQRKKEFYAMPKEVVYNFFYKMASLSGTLDRLHLCEEEEPSTKEEADEIASTPYESKNLLANKNAIVIELYKKIVDAMKQKFKGLSEKTTPNYIALRNERKQNICEFHFQKTKLLITTREPKTKTFKEGFKVPDTYLWALNYKYYISDVDKVNDAVDLLTDVYEQIKK